MPPAARLPVHRGQEAQSARRKNSTASWRGSVKNLSPPAPGRLLLLVYLYIVELPPLRVFALKGAGHRLPILRNYRPTGYDNLAVDLHRYVKRVVIDVFHCDHGGSHRTIDFMLHPVPWNSGRHIYLLAV